MPRPTKPNLIQLRSKPNSPKSKGVLGSILIFIKQYSQNKHNSTAIIENAKRMEIYRRQRGASEWDAYDEARAAFQLDYKSWSDNFKKIQQNNQEMYEKQLLDWQDKKSNFEKKKRESINSLKKLETASLSGNSRDLEQYLKIVLQYSSYPKDILPNFEVSCDIDSSIILMECYVVPYASFNPLRNDGRRQPLAARTRQKLYDQYIFSVILRSAYEIKSLPVMRRIGTLAVNVKTIIKNPANGLDATLNLASVMMPIDILHAIDIQHVDAEAFFRKQNGIAAASLSENIEVAPIIKFDKNDNRFIEARTINPQIGENLAEIPWEDFEHLVRQLFEKHFSDKNVDVKITQSSRDQGVDAVIFNSDPILGGKIVIQAKRYTNTVDVKYVRELWATTQNEGANKGILVTTSNFGPDSYAWASGKNLQLINGSQFLVLLKENGFSYSLDLDQARKNRNQS